MHLLKFELMFLYNYVFTQYMKPKHKRLLAT